MIDQKQLYQLADRKLLELAEMSNVTVGEREAYEESLKYYRDIKNVVDTSREEGSEERAVTIARRMLDAGLGVEQVAEFTGLGVEQLHVPRPSGL